MAAEQPVILYDIPSRDPKTCWSWNVWRARFTLNYKGIPYETEWTEYPDIKPKFQSHFPEKDEFTCPSVKLPDGTYIMDSKLIAEHFEKKQPNPPLRMESPYVQSILTPLRELLIPLQPVYLYLVPTRLLGEASIPYFRSTREKDIGKTLEAMHDEAIDGVWGRAAPGIHKIVTALNENKGPFLEGETVCYADFMLGGVLITLKCLGDDIWDEVIKASPDGGKAILGFLKGLEPWSRAN